MTPSLCTVTAVTELVVNRDPFNVTASRSLFMRSRREAARDHTAASICDQDQTARPRHPKAPSR